MDLGISGSLQRTLFEQAAGNVSHQFRELPGFFPP